jgi:hypothetical protein
MAARLQDIHMIGEERRGTPEESGQRTDERAVSTGGREELYHRPVRSETTTGNLVAARW